MTTLYLIQTNKPRSVTGARPIPVFFALFAVEHVKGRKGAALRGTLVLSTSQKPGTYVVEVAGEAPPIALFRACVNKVLSTFGTEPCASVRKKIAKIADDAHGESDTLEGLLGEKGYMFSVMEI